MASGGGRMRDASGVCLWSVVTDALSARDVAHGGSTHVAPKRIAVKLLPEPDRRHVYRVFAFFGYSGIVPPHMKQDTHPKNYRPVIFHDNASGARFLISSTVNTSGTDTWKDGKEYPVAHVEVSSASHPFYTGTEKVMDTAGRVEKFKARAEAAANRKKKA